MLMSRKSDVLVGLDIGTTKTTAIVGEVTETGIDIIGIGTGNKFRVFDGRNGRRRSDGFVEGNALNGFFPQDGVNNFDLVGRFSDTNF